MKLIIEISETTRNPHMESLLIDKIRETIEGFGIDWDDVELTDSEIQTLTYQELLDLQDALMHALPNLEISFSDESIDDAIREQLDSVNEKIRKHPEHNKPYQNGN